MTFKTKIILLTTSLFISCSSIDLEKENKIIQDELKEKKQMTENVIQEKKGILTLDDCIDIALKNNSKIKLKQIEEEISKLDKRISFGNFLPKISSLYTFNEMDRTLNTKLSNPEISLDVFGGIKLPEIPVSMSTRMVDKSFRNYSINAQLPIFVPATWFLYSARSKAEDISRYSKDLMEKMIRLKVIGEYYYILALESERKVLESELKYAEKINANAKVALETESILRWQYLQTEVLKKQKEDSLENNFRDLKIAKMNLLNDLNLNLESDFKLEIPKEPIIVLDSLENYIYEALVNSEYININHNLVAINKDKVKIAISQFLPQIALNGGYYGTSLSMFSPQGFLFGTIGGILSIFDGFKNINEYKKAKLGVEAAYIKREEAVANTIIATVTAYNNLKKSLDEKELAEMNYSVIKDKFEKKTLENQVGYISETDYIKEFEEFEKAASLREKSNYKYRVVAEAFNSIIGRMKKLVEKGDGINIPKNNEEF